MLARQTLVNLATLQYCNYRTTLPCGIICHTVCASLCVGLCNPSGDGFQNGLPAGQCTAVRAAIGLCWYLRCIGNTSSMIVCVHVTLCLHSPQQGCVYSGVEGLLEPTFLAVSPGRCWSVLAANSLESAHGNVDITITLRFFCCRSLIPCLARTDAKLLILA